MTLGNHHMTCHMFNHVTSWHLWDHMIYKHIILGKYHMTYQGIGYQHNHKLHYNHLIICASDTCLVCWSACGRPWEWSTNQQVNKQVTRPWSVVVSLTCYLYLYLPLKHGLPVWVCMPALNMYAQTTLYKGLYLLKALVDSRFEAGTQSSERSHKQGYNWGMKLSIRLRLPKLSP